MALRTKKTLALQMRHEGASYSQIKEKLQVSKSTLSLWLRDLPLSEQRLRELRDFSEVRIERYRATRKRTREARWEDVYKKISKDIGVLTNREKMIAGLFLYWGEGGKTEWTTTVLSNTDPAMLKFFIDWLVLFGVSKKQVRARLHLYIDMNVQKELTFWSKELGLPMSSFRRPHIKSSRRSDLTYASKSAHGTCDVMYGNRDVAEYVQMGLRYVRDLVAEGGKA